MPKLPKELELRLRAEIEEKERGFQLAAPEERPLALCRLSDAIQALAYLQVGGVPPKQYTGKEAGGAITIPFCTPLREVERLVIEATLEYTDGNVAATARILRIGRSRLYERIRGYRRAAKDISLAEKGQPGAHYSG